MQSNDQLQDLTVIDGEVVEVKTPDAALAVMNPVEYTKQLFEPFRQQLALAKRRANRVTYDLSTDEGLAQAAQVARTFTKIRTSCEKAKTEAKRPIDQTGKLILSGCNEVVALVRVEEDRRILEIEGEKLRRAKIEEERQRLERARIEAIENRIESLRLIPSTLVRADSATIQERLDKLVMQALSPDDFEEHLEIAITAQNTAINELRQLLTETRNREAQAAELARLRAADAEREEKARLEREAAAKREAEMLAQMEEMKRQMAAMQAAAAPAGIVSDVTAPRSEADVVMPIEADDTGVVVGEAVLSSEAVEQLAEQLAEPVELTLAGTGGARLAVPPAKRLSDLDILELVARAGDVPSMTALSWLATFDVEAVRAALAEGA